MTGGQGPDRVLVEAIDGHGRVQWRERIALDNGRRAFTVGRSLEADVTLDDPYVAALHASIEIGPDGRLLATDLGSVNGLILRGRRAAAGCGLELPDNTLQVGRTHLRIRTGFEPLAAEKPYQSLAASLLRGPGGIAAVAAVVSVLQIVYASWLGAPRDLTVSIVTALGYAVSIAAVWVAFWGLLSRIMQGEWRWLRHSAIYLGVTSAFIAIVGVVDLSMSLLSLRHDGDLYIWLGAIGLAGALHLHLRHASHLGPGRAALVACIIPMVLAGVGQWLQMRTKIRDVNHINAYVRIYPPGLRLRAAEGLDDYFTRALRLRDLADRRLAEALASEPTPEDEN